MTGVKKEVEGTFKEVAGMLKEGAGKALNKPGMEARGQSRSFCQARAEKAAGPCRESIQALNLPAGKLQEAPGRAGFAECLLLCPGSISLIFTGMPLQGKYFQ